MWERHGGRSTPTTIPTVTTGAATRNMQWFLCLAIRPHWYPCPLVSWSCFQSPTGGGATWYRHNLEKCKSSLSSQPISFCKKIIEMTLNLIVTSVSYKNWYINWWWSVVIGSFKFTVNHSQASDWFATVYYTEIIPKLLCFSSY